MTTWTKIAKPSGTSWTKIVKPASQATSGGEPIGLLLALTYTTLSDNWIRISKPTGTVWTKITKAP